MIQNDCETTLYQTGIWIKNNTNKEIVGAFDSGIIGFVSEKTVVNLDGVVNPVALKYLKKKALMEYLKMRNISIIVDTRNYLKGEKTNLEKIKVFEKDGCPKRIIYKIK